MRPRAVQQSRQCLTNIQHQVLVPVKQLRALGRQLEYSSRSAARQQHPATVLRAANEFPEPRPYETDLTGFLDKNFARRLNLSPGLLYGLANLPGTKSHSILRERAAALAEWRTRLSKGVLPPPKQWSWPDEPFQGMFAKTMRNLEMPRFCRRYPKLTDAVLRQMLELVQEFEARMEELQAQQEAQQQQQQQQQSGSPSLQQQQKQQGDPSSDGNEQQEGEPQEADSGEGDSTTQNMTQEQLEEAIKSGAAKPSGQEQDLKMQLDSAKGAAPELSKEMEKELEKAAASAAKDLVKEFEEKWKPIMDNVSEAETAFEDLSSLMDGPEGFDSSHAVWRASGWREVAALRKRLSELKELRELVRSLGRSGGKGPLRRAPEQIWNQRGRPGVIRSELQPEETRGLTRSGDLSRMLPFEAHLLSFGSKSRRNGALQAGADPASTAEADATEVDPTRSASSAHRRLFMVRRAERMLGSYQREGWLDEQPSRATGRFEIRPASEQGPIIVCLDTSGSMTGPRETVAKAVALECMRGAHRQGRACFLYAFSGPGDVQGMELGTEPNALAGLLNFLTNSFGGGTDVDAPLDLSLKRVAQAAWSQADILLVSDGEIPHASKDIQDRLAAARADLDLEVHGLLVGQKHQKQAMEELCTHLHIFKSWDAAGGRAGQYY